MNLSPANDLRAEGNVVAILCRGCAYLVPRYSFGFDQVSRIAEEIAENSLWARMAGRDDISQDFWTAYLVYLKACNWTEKDYNDKMLSRIDKAW